MVEEEVRKRKSQDHRMAEGCDESKKRKYESWLLVVFQEGYQS
jgi:hypothetical protein